MTELISAENLALIPATWIYSGLFVMCLLEGTPVAGSFFPGGTVLFAVGAVAGVGIVDPTWVVVLAALGSILGDLLGYFVLRYYGYRIKLLSRLMERVRGGEGWLSDVFDKRYFVITILARIIPYLRVATSIAAASRAISMRGYILATILSSTLWAASVVVLGYSLTGFLAIKYIIVSLIIFSVFSALWTVMKYVIKLRAKKRLSSVS